MRIDNTKVSLLHWFIHYTIAFRAEQEAEARRILEEKEMRREERERKRKEKVLGNVLAVV